MSAERREGTGNGARSGRNGGRRVFVRTEQDDPLRFASAVGPGAWAEQKSRVHFHG